MNIFWRHVSLVSRRLVGPRHQKKSDQWCGRQDAWGEDLPVGVAQLLRLIVGRRELLR